MEASESVWTQRTSTLEGLIHKLAGATVFSKLDAKNGNRSEELDEQSFYLTTFNTPFGRYKYLRMPFGLIMSQDVCGVGQLRHEW